MPENAVEDFVGLDVAFDPQDISAAAYEFIRSRWPDYVPSPAQLDTWIIESNSSISSELANLIAVVGKAIFKQFGTTIVDIPVDLGQQAVAYTTWTAFDTNGYTIPSGTEISVDDDAGNSYAFATQADFTIDPGGDTLADVPVYSINRLTEVNDLTANPTLLSPLGFITDVVITTPPTDGRDPETDDDYINRLAATLRTLSPKPIIPIDFSRIALMDDRVDRAITIDLWDAVTPATGVEKYVGMVLLDSAGEEVSSTVEDEIQAKLQAMREANFVVTIGAPTYLEVDVTTSVKATPGADPVMIQTQIEDALTRFLDPANWGVSSDADVWVNTTTVRYLDVAQVVRSIPNVFYIETLQIGPHGGSMGTADLVIAGTVGLTRPGTFAVTVDS